MANALTGMPSVWADLNIANSSGNLATLNAQQLAEQEQLLRKKRMMSAGAPGGVLGVSQTLLGSRDLGSATAL